MIDVVYPMANLSKFKDDWELRYSLRSLSQQNWVRNVYLVGYYPKWAQNVIHIPCPDPYTACKDANIINKILLACSCVGLSGYFLVNSDDQYILKSIMAEDIVPMLENPNRFSEFKMKAQTNSWPQRVINTVGWCKNHNYPDWIFQSHSPYVINKNEYPVAMSNVAWGQGNGVTTHIYFNLTLKDQPEKEPPGRTVRCKGRIQEDELRKMIKQGVFLNNNDSGLTPIFKAFIEEYFPVKSRWEK